ncbi:MAG: thiamine ABC transporter substrate-binding protein [Candidatus Hodarchaeales archaeon]
MKRSWISAVFVLTFVINIVISGSVANGLNRSQDTMLNLNENQLVVYTYDSLLADPFYDIEGNFSTYANIPRDTVQVIRFSDANEIITRIIAEKDQPQADVVVGIDNALIHMVQNIDEVLEVYSSVNLSQIDDNLIQNLDPEKYLLPYDYGIISFYYQNQIVNSTTYPEIQNLTLDSLLDSELLTMLLVENPRFSSPGLGFLLWTIAVYGDPDIGFMGLLGSDWRDWWRQAKTSITITKSWGDAFDIFFEKSENKPIMISYGTSPAYGYCQWRDNSTSAMVTYENSKANSWLQIEGLGLVKNAPNKEMAKKFIDWFLGVDLQSELPEHQWMYPANVKANVSECFRISALSPENMTRLNDLISPEMLEQYLVTWLDQWEQVVVNKAISGFSSPIALFSVLVLTVTLRKKLSFQR